MDKFKKLEPGLWILLIIVAIMTIIAIKVTYGF